jgi:hypothetical protein
MCASACILLEPVPYSFTVPTASEHPSKQKERTLAGPLSRVEMIMSPIKLRNGRVSGKFEVRE